MQIQHILELDSETLLRGYSHLSLLVGFGILVMSQQQTLSQAHDVGVFPSYLGLS
jgi:hypothetical protein